MRLKTTDSYTCNLHPEPFNFSDKSLFKLHLYYFHRHQTDEELLPLLIKKKVIVRYPVEYNPTIGKYVELRNQIVNAYAKSAKSQVEIEEFEIKLMTYNPKEEV